MSFTQPAPSTPPAHAGPGVPESPIPLPAAPLGPETVAAIQFIALDRIHPSPFNPRKDFDPASIAELAESIKVQGLQQNLVVRPHPAKKGHYELMGGERRWRALELLEAPGAPCKVEEASDGESLARQLVENLQRQDVAPMEEAQAFDTLNRQDPKRWSTTNIAAAIGKTQRFVQQRLGLVRNLAPKTQELLKGGNITIETARTLAATPQSLQAKVLERSWDIPQSVEAARERIAQHAVPLAAAAFDVALYSGDFIEDDKRRMFGDVALFTRLQTGAAKARVDTLKEKWPDAKVVKEGALDGWVWGDSGSSVKWNKDHKVAGKPKGNCTALVYIDADHKLRIAEGVKPRPPQPTSRSHTPAPVHKETAERKAERTAFNAKVVAALAKDADVAIRLLLLDILRGDQGYDEPAELVKAALPSLPVPTGNYLAPSQVAKLWPKIAALKQADVVKALAAIGAGTVGDDSGQWWHEHDKDCPPDLLAIAASLGVKPEPVKPTLAAIAADKAKAADRPAAKKKAAKKAAIRKKHQ